MRCTSLDEQKNGTPEPRRRRRAAAQQKAFEEFEREQQLEQQRADEEPAGQDAWSEDESGSSAGIAKEAPRRMKAAPTDKWLDDEDED